MNRDIAFTTDYLLESQNNLDKTVVMNQIFYTIENGERKVKHIGRLFENLVGPNYMQLLQNNVQPYKDVIKGSNDLANDLTEALMGKGATGTSIIDLENQTDHGLLKLANVHDDQSSRGILKDYRYHGVGTDACGNPIFADDVPLMSGGFGLQVARMISSGLVNKQNDVYIISNRDEIVDSIRHPSEPFKDLNQGNQFDTTQHLSTTSDNARTENKYVSRVAHYIDNKLKEIANDEYIISQYLLEQIYLKDPLRFQVNEIARNDTVDLDIKTRFQKDGEILYMLPLIKEDTLSIASVVNGIINDPYEDSQARLGNILNTINTKLVDPNNPSKVNRFEASTISLTGNPEKDGVKQDISGIFIRSSNLFYFPEFGPYQKYLITNYEIESNDNIEANIKFYDNVKSTNDSKIYLGINDVNEIIKIAELMKERLQIYNGSLEPYFLSDETNKYKKNISLKTKFIELYRRFREKIISYSLYVKGRLYNN